LTMPRHRQESQFTYDTSTVLLQLEQRKAKNENELEITTSAWFQSILMTDTDSNYSKFRLVSFQSIEFIISGKLRGFEMNSGYFVL